MQPADKRQSPDFSETGRPSASLSLALSGHDVQPPADRAAAVTIATASTTASREAGFVRWAEKPASRLR